MPFPFTEGGASRRRSRRLVALQAKKHVTSHDPEEVYDAFMSAADPQQFQVGEEEL